MHLELENALQRTTILFYLITAHHSLEGEGVVAKKLSNKQQTIKQTSLEGFKGGPESF